MDGSRISITDISSDAESREEQDGWQQNSVRPTTAELWPILWPHAMKRMKKGSFCLFEPSWGWMLLTEIFADATILYRI